jgi:hypothetical protein
MLASSFPLHNLIPDWKDLLHLSSEEYLKILKRHEHTGRPLGCDSFVAKLEKSSAPPETRPQEEYSKLDILSPELAELAAGFFPGPESQVVKNCSVEPHDGSFRTCY